MKRKQLIVLLASLLLAQTVFAQLLVSIDPKEETEFLYPFEVAFYNVSYYNSGNTPIESLSVNITVSDDLRLIEEDKEMTEISFDLEDIEPRASGKKEIKIRALEASGGKNYITATFGKKIFTHSVSTFVQIKESLVEIRSRIEKSSISPGEENTVFLDIENKSDKALSNLTAKLILPEGVDLVLQPTITEALSPQQAVLNSQFIFRASKTGYGRKVIILQISYVEEGVKHVIEKRFEVDVGEREVVMYLLVVIIIGLILVSYFLGRKGPSKAKQKKELKPETKPEKKGKNSQA